MFVMRAVQVGAAALIHNVDGVDAQRTSQLDGGAGRGDHTGYRRTHVGCVDVNTHGHEVFASVHAGCERTEGLGEHNVRAAVQQADGLGVARQPAWWRRRVRRSAP